MNNATTVSPAGLKFIQSFEGCVLKPYEDQGGTPTIGWGMTHYPNGTKVTMSDPALTQEQADAYFAELVVPYCQGVLKCVTVPLNQNQLDALTDFVYNLGVGALEESTLAILVNGIAVEGIDQVEEVDFTVYDHIGTVVNAGLLKRRQAEYQLFIKPITTMEPISNPVTEPANVDVTTATKQVIQVKKVTVDWTKSIDGGVDANGQSELAITPEIIAMVQAIQDPAYNIVVTA